MAKPTNVPTTSATMNQQARKPKPQTTMSMNISKPRYSNNTISGNEDLRKIGFVAKIKRRKSELRRYFSSAAFCNGARASAQGRQKL
jgi:hypothetical protein